MKPFLEELDELWEKARTSIIKKVRTHGQESKNYNFKVIKLDDERAFNLDAGYADEIGESAIVSNRGLLYGMGVLTHEQLFDIADWLNEKYK